MKTIAIIKNNIVENIAAWQGCPKWEAAMAVNYPDYVLVDITSLDVMIGDIYLGNGQFQRPEPVL